MNQETKNTHLPKKYSVELTRVNKRSIAPPGEMYLIVKHKDFRSTYINYILVPASISDDFKDEVAEKLWNQLAEKYKL